MIIKFENAEGVQKTRSFDYPCEAIEYFYNNDDLALMIIPKAITNRFNICTTVIGNGHGGWQFPDVNEGEVS